MPTTGPSLIGPLVAGALVLLVTAAPSANAADMDPYYVPKRGSPYDDPRYGDIYRHPPPPSRHAEPRYYEPPPPPYIPRDRYGYLEPMPRIPGFREHRYAEREMRCLPRHEIKRMLHERGWHEFQEVELSGEVAFLNARRASGNLYELRIDRCTGEVIGSRFIAGPSDRPYAWRERPGYRWY
jgi:hypothetical protein